MGCFVPLTGWSGDDGHTDLPLSVVSGRSSQGAELGAWLGRYLHHLLHTYGTAGRSGTEN